MIANIPTPYTIVHTSGEITIIASEGLDRPTTAWPEMPIMSAWKSGCGGDDEIEIVDSPVVRVIIIDVIAVN